MKILVIEDDPGVSIPMGRLLKENGHETRSCNNGDEGLSLLRSEPFDLVLLDLVLPEMSGYEFIKIKMSEEAIAKIPIALFTARRAIRLPDGQVRAILLKPLDPSDIIHTLSNLSQTLLMEEKVGN